MIKEIFEKNVLKLEGNGNCWIWQDNLSQGYGRLKFCGVLVLAHRFAYELYNNAPVDQSYGVLHKCHNKQCVNPEHLYLGSAQENSRDWIESRKKDIVSNPVVSIHAPARGATCDEYKKILNPFMRDHDNGGRLVYGAWTLPMFEYLAYGTWILTEKVGGVNVRVVVDSDNKTVSFYGRTDKAVIPVPLATHLTYHFNPISSRLFEAFPRGACLYGEGYGAGIRDGVKYKKTQSFIMFDIMADGRFMDHHEVEAVGELLSILVVPVVGEGSLFDAIDAVSNNMKSRWGNFTSEGIVAKTKVCLYDKYGNRAITKIQYRDFKGYC